MAGEGGFAYSAEGRDGDYAAVGEGGEAVEEEFFVEFYEGLVAAYEMVYGRCLRRVRRSLALRSRRGWSQ